MFIEKMKSTLNDEFNYSTTENGALGYRTSGKNLVDLNFAVSSLRDATESGIEKMLDLAFFEDKILALKWLFFARDVRGGLGERRLFRIVLKHLSSTEYLKGLIPLVEEYGRFDDLLCLLDTPYKKQVVDLFALQLKEDVVNYKKNQQISLLAKWLPSENTSSKETQRLAKILIDGFETTPKQYRKTLSALRKYLDVVEIKMSKKEWKAIDYSKVPSRANLFYNSAFLKNDEKRRREFLEKVENGEEKINSSVLFPHDIVNKYRGFRSKDGGLEAMWKGLKDTESLSNTIVVADGSGSMESAIGKTGVTALSVANALSIYFAERIQGEFKNKYITFSESPKLVDFSNCSSLFEKIALARRYDEVANTNIEAVFNLILTTAKKHDLSQDEIPKNILILSDMEFDSATRSYHNSAPSERLFATINAKYAQVGYKLPKLIFWNLNSRTGTIPVIENELGVALVSGFSPNIAKMVMSLKLDPYEILMETLNSERYLPIGEAIK